MRITKNLAVIITMFILASCQSEEMIEAENQNESMSNELKLTLEAEQFSYDENFRRETKLLYGTTKVEVVVLGDGNYALGDMIFSDEDFADKNAIESSSNAKKQGVWDRRETKWPNNTILYKYSNNMPQTTKNKVNNAASYITMNTDLTVRKWVTSDGNNVGFVFVTYNDDGCSAQIGFKNSTISGQRMNIGPDCSEGSTIHEFLHAAGIVHEQNHWNRDSYVDILYRNIIDEKEFNYIKISDIDGWEYSDIVDLNSIMMYGSFFWQTPEAKTNGWRTMTTKTGGTIVPNRSFMTINDISIINTVY